MFTDIDLNFQTAVRELLYDNDGLTLVITDMVTVNEDISNNFFLKNEHFSFGITFRLSYYG